MKNMIIRIKYIMTVLSSPRNIIIFLAQKRILNISDEKFLKLLYKKKLNKNLDLDNPITFNEKLQWLKLHDRKQIYSTMVDKYEAKKYVASIIGKEYIIPTIGIYDTFDDIDFESLPNQFVMKCTHDSGGIIIVKDKTSINIKSIKKKFNKCLRRNYYYSSREWPYKNVKPRIIIEKFMQDDNNVGMRDYKFFCFSGVPKLLYLSEGLENHKTARISFYDMDFNLTDCRRKDYKPIEYKPSVPKNFEKMKEFATILSNGFPHLRVDFYEINGKLYFGELTFYTCTGMIPFADSKWDKKLGDMINLPKN